MRTWGLLFFVGIAFAAVGCPSNNQVSLPPPGTVPVQFVYWTFDNNAPGALPQIETAAYPLTNASTAIASVPSNGTNSLSHASPLLFDSLGRLWVGNGVGTCIVAVFSPPLSASSTPLFVLTLSGCAGLFGMAFDHSGNLWASGFDSSNVKEFTGPFTSTATLTAANTLAVSKPGYPAFDAAGNLYVPKDAVTYAVDVFSAPIGAGASPSFTLGGVTEPFATAFDVNGNLYVGQRGSLTRYNSNNLSSGATPSIVDATSQLSGDFAGQLVIDAAGNLYATNCGLSGNPRIMVFPTVASSFGTSLAPTVSFSDAAMTTSGCTWGVAIH